MTAPDDASRRGYSELMLADLVSEGVLCVVVENHLFEYVTRDIGSPAGVGVRAGRRCRKCGQWAMGERPGDSADERCPEVRHRFVTGWRDGTYNASREGAS